ncbi:hypothetical protein AVEN_248896-1 [Araneus ventricosus]|uniref:Uncharacterized protein n=1 Tax=Araneus ventricosus TaxID=182803 RepID=A0A4Y2EFD1_ARAVE|nr:hypothetical protein AVEN_66098-1 [Araneus ventricosus]GBM27850.1 hypothetical protein AVEN_248896-1 [Araneus ventricosus]
MTSEEKISQTDSLDNASEDSKSLDLNNDSVCSSFTVEPSGTLSEDMKSKSDEFEQSQFLDLSFDDLSNSSEAGPSGIIAESKNPTNFEEDQSSRSPSESSSEEDLKPLTDEDCRLQPCGEVFISFEHLCKYYPRNYVFED